MNNPNKHPYGFQLALWIALEKGSTVISQAERVDPLCKWVVNGITPDNALDIRKLKGACGGTDWRVNGFSTSYKEQVAEQFTAMPDDAELQSVHERFMNSEYYSSCGYKNMRSQPKVCAKKGSTNGTASTTISTENEMQEMSTST